jgi:hypothetical protein
VPTEISNPKTGKVLTEVSTTNIDELMSMMDSIKKKFGLNRVIVRRY